MFEELTPRLLSTLLLLVLCVASVLTLLLSAPLLWLYRRAVMRLMETSVSSKGITPASESSAVMHADEGPCEPASGIALYQQTVRGPWRLALGYLGAGLVFALVFAIAAHFVYPHRLGLAGFVIAVWIYLWPVVPALLLIVPTSWRIRFGYVAIYFGVFLLLIFWASTIADIPATRFGAITLPARSSATPQLTMKLWLIVNAVPTLLVLLCFNRTVRAVAPLVLAFVAIAIAGTLVSYFAQFSGRGADATVAASQALHLHVVWIVLGTMLLSIIAFAAIGWLIARWIAAAYRRKTVSDQSLMLDALWILFASSYAMWLVLGGLVWTTTAIAGFGMYKLALLANRLLDRTMPAASRDLVFLRVFSLGRRSERLLDTVARYWRYSGRVQIITGPDIARSTVQPHQFLDFLSGKLASHFVRDADSLQRSMAEWDRARDADGRFRINNFFCHADSWRDVLPRLVQTDDVVLMDLRSFSMNNSGCIHELQHLVDNVPLEHCLLLVDDRTDLEFLERTLRRLWQSLPRDSPNHDRSPNDTALHRLDPNIGAVRELVQHLCHAGTVTLSDRGRRVGSPIAWRE